MQRFIVPVAIGLSLLALTLACHGRALLQGEQYAYRDAAHYYYPLHQRVQQEWSAGRVPLWDPSENAGMPLLGNPTAAVLYPGKLVFAVFPYSVAARLYIVLHSLLAFMSMFVLARYAGIGMTGAGVSGLSYAFGGPVLFQYSNVIYLIGAAWAPLGVAAIDRWVRCGDRRAIYGLAMVLAMEFLGGDPESAYLTGLLAVVYAFGLVGFRRSEATTSKWSMSKWSITRMLGYTTTLILLWFVTTLLMAAWAPGRRAPASALLPPKPLPWAYLISTMVNIAWLVVILYHLQSWWRSRKDHNAVLITPKVVGLIVAALLSCGLSAVQLLPVLEFMRQTGRQLGEGSHEIFSFSFEPIRLMELIWPNVGGGNFATNHDWLNASNWGGKAAKIWVPSLYVGGFTIMLTLAAWRIRSRRPVQVLMSLLLIFSLFAAFGEYGSPIWLARHFPRVASIIGEHDPASLSSVIREDGKLRDGDGSLYWLLATLLPGFRQFRFPSKFLTFTAMAISVLAGFGWDELVAGDRATRRRVMVFSSIILILTLLASLVLQLYGEHFLLPLKGKPQESIGPIDIPGTLKEIERSLIHGGLIAALVFALAIKGWKNSQWLSVLMLVIFACDLSIGNAGLVQTAAQRLFDDSPEVLEIIKQSEQTHQTPGPYRIHRMPIWEPVGWSKTGSADRSSEFVEWERRTLQPKYGISLGVEYTQTIGVAELRDYRAFFQAYLGELSAADAKMLNIRKNRDIVIFPRRSFDIWNTRYFVLPSYPNNWADATRGFVSFVDQTEVVYPPPNTFRGEGGRERLQDWYLRNDFQIRRNLTEFPRAWVVHRGVELVESRSSEKSRLDPAGIEDILFSEADRWRDPTRVVHDPRSVAWLERGRLSALKHFMPGGARSSGESVRITKYESDRVEIEVDVDRPGLLILADVYYPGWQVSVDGNDVAIERVNRMMRGVAIEKGAHRLVFRYEPGCFRVGIAVSLVTIIGLLFYFVRFDLKRSPAVEMHKTS